MTALEEETFRDGFRVALVHVTGQRGGPTALRARLFDGGRQVDALDAVAPGALPPEAYTGLRRFLARVAAPPHVLALWGDRRRAVLGDVLGERAATTVVTIPRASARASL